MAGVLYHVPIACTNATRPSEELFPDLHDFSRSDFGLGVGGQVGVALARESTCAPRENVAGVSV